MSSIPHYVYVVVRRDLPLCHQITQSCHAAFERGVDLLERKHEGISRLVTLSVTDEPELRKLHTQLQEAGIPAYLFWEPDDLTKTGQALGHTALAAGPVQGEDRAHFGTLPLWTPE